MRNVFLCIALFFIVPAQAQITFEELYGTQGATMHFGFSVQQTLDGGYILAGGAQFDATIGSEMYLVKVDESGAMEWERTFGTLGLDRAYCVRQRIDGGYVLCGAFDSFGNDSLTIIRTDPAGDMLWERQYGGSVGRNMAYSLVESLDGGIVVTGFRGANPVSDILVLKVDGDGDVLWTSVIDLGGEEYGNTIRLMSDGGYMIVADNGEYDPDGDIHLLRLNADGDTLWTRTFDSGMHDTARGLWVNDDGGCIIAGGRDYPSRDIFLLRTDEQGNELWRRSHGDPTRDELAMDVQQLDDGGFIICGRKEDPLFNDDITMHLFRTDADGYIMWERTWGQGIFSEAMSLDRTTDGGFVLLGHTLDNLGGMAYGHMYLVKTDGAGYSMVAEQEAEHSLLSVFPNPTSAMVSFTADNSIVERLQAFDAQGRSVLDRLGAGLSHGTIDLSGLESGSYLLRATLRDGQHAVARIVVAR